MKLCIELLLPQNYAKAFSIFPGVSSHFANSGDSIDGIAPDEGAW